MSGKKRRQPLFLDAQKHLPVKGVESCQGLRNAAAHLLEQQAQGALRIAVEAAEAVGGLARKQGHGLAAITRAAGARQRPHRQRLAAARRAVQQDAPAASAELM